jgi:hypothetical protein
VYQAITGAAAAASSQPDQAIGGAAAAASSQPVVSSPPIV